MKKYHFVLIGTGDNRIYGDAHTLVGVKSIFKKVNANKCMVFKRDFSGRCPIKPFVVFVK